MVEVTVKVNLDAELSEANGPAIIFTLQVIATLIGVFYLVYEAVYPSVVSRRAALERKEEFDKRYKFNSLNTDHLVEGEDDTMTRLGEKFSHIGAQQAGMTREVLLDSIVENGEAAGLNMSMAK